MKLKREKEQEGEGSVRGGPAWTPTLASGIQLPVLALPGSQETQ